MSRPDRVAPDQIPPIADSETCRAGPYAPWRVRLFAGAAILLASVASMSFVFIVGFVGGMFNLSVLLPIVFVEGAGAVFGILLLVDATRVHSGEDPFLRIGSSTEQRRRHRTRELAVGAAISTGGLLYVVQVLRFTSAAGASSAAKIALLVPPVVMIAGGVEMMVHAFARRARSTAGASIRRRG